MSIIGTEGVDASPRKENNMNTDRKRTILLAAALAALIAVFALVWWFNRPETSGGSKNITVEVIHKDESKKTFPCKTDEEYLDKVLVGEGIVEDNQADFGLYILVVDGERADYNEDGAYWAVLQNGEATVTGASETPIHDGDVISLVYTRA